MKTHTTEDKLLSFLNWCRNRPAFNSPVIVSAYLEEQNKQIEHKWDGPIACVGGMVDVATCSVCGADVSDYDKPYCKGNQ